jgi:hypothetical protein
MDHRNCAGGQCEACKQQALDSALQAFPLSQKLGLVPAFDGQRYYPGFDLEDVEKSIEGRFKEFFGTLKEDFVCGHRVHEAGHPEERLRGTVAHCCWGKDLEAFLAGGK